MGQQRSLATRFQKLGRSSADRLVPVAQGVEVDRHDAARSRTYWMTDLHNHCIETLDSVNHQSTLNCDSARLEADGYPLRGCP